eukprot:CAMPEP_0172421490 /NCGR_PEP_ID=MMETSP1064-20121228/7738_1 /TAXON_ID=202472 /ORGANISM="Aulacoseira subarctica , Strain CCAP 1002/5" /LENGTH=139 /DNA_ID=CAMNT_0013161923 /DNA_START=66 /DNA_END=485 /DNA_ORIENTATION=-
MTFHKILSFTSVIIASLFLTACFAFIPSRNAGNRILITSLNVVSFDRRQALESLLVASTTGSSFAILAGGAGNANAAENPALKTFKGRGKGVSFYPGKGMRSHEELVAAANPALKTFEGRGKGVSFYPGKGMRSHEEVA